MTKDVSMVGHADTTPATYSDTWIYLPVDTIWQQQQVSCTWHRLCVASALVRGWGGQLTLVGFSPTLALWMRTQIYLFMCMHARRTLDLHFLPLPNLNCTSGSNTCASLTSTGHWQSSGGAIGTLTRPGNVQSHDVSHVWRTCQRCRR